MIAHVRERSLFTSHFPWKTMTEIGNLFLKAHLPYLSHQDRAVAIP
jgi:hypothetical protein